MRWATLHSFEAAVRLGGSVVGAGKNDAVLFADVVATSQAVAATRSRLAKRDALVTLLRNAAGDDIPIVVAYLAGELRQRRTGIGWASLRAMPDAAAAPLLSVVEVDSRLQAISLLAGPGSAAARTAAVAALFAAATAPEQSFLRRLIGGEIRQGALDSAMVDAVAVAADVPLVQVRRAVMLAGGSGAVAVAALTRGREGVGEFDLQVGRPVRPMLAASAPDVTAACAKIGADKQVAVDVKIDGIRIQAHRDGTDVRLFTRSLDDVTGRLPEVVAAMRCLPVDRAILDGEVIALGSDGRPRAFQETASRTATASSTPPSPTTTSAKNAEPPADSAPGGNGGSYPLSVFFFDALVLDNDVLLDLPLADRLRRLDAVIPAANRVSRVITADVGTAQRHFDVCVAGGHEGVVVKALDAPYEAGRRGAGWIKVKPRHTLDLVVLAVEWGSGRRAGLLSNIHLGARDPDTGGFVMLGKTFKGMTDEMLAWQTQRFTELALQPVQTSSWVVEVRPQQVVEIAFDGLQRSTRYPGGLALRFARVLRYRDDKTAAEADTIDTVRAVGGVVG